MVFGVHTLGGSQGFGEGEFVRVDIDPDDA